MPDGAFASPIDAVGASLGNVELEPTSPLTADALELAPLSVDDPLYGEGRVSATLLTTSGTAKVVLTQMPDGTYQLHSVIQCQMDEEGIK